MNLKIHDIVLLIKKLNWQYWFSNSGFTILDQFLFSGSNFVINILLARWFSPEEYGNFTLLFSILLFFSGFHTALLTEPMSVLGAKYIQKFKSYYLHSVKLHFIITGIMSLIIVLATLGLETINVISGPLLYYTDLLWMGLMLPLILYIWFERRYSYLIQQPNRSFRISLIYSISLTLFVFLIFRQAAFSVSNVFVIFGLCSMMSSIFLNLKKFKKIFVVDQSLDALKIFKENWNYGKWMLGVVSVQWLSGHFYIVLAASFLNLSEVGGYKALYNLVLPVLQIQAALLLFFLPILSKLNIKVNIDKFKEMLTLISLGFFGLNLIYVMFVFQLRDFVFDYLYVNKYNDYKELLPWFLLLPILISLNSILQMSFKAMHKSKKVFEIYIYTSLFTVFVGSGLVYFSGMIGLVIGIVSTAAIQLIITFTFHKNLLKNI